MADLLQEDGASCDLSLIGLSEDGIEGFSCAQGENVQRYFKNSEMFHSFKRLEGYRRLNCKRSICEIVANADQKRFFSEELNRKRDIHAVIAFEDIASYSCENQFQYSFLLLYHFLVSTDHSSFGTSSPLTKKKMFSQYF